MKICKKCGMESQDEFQFCPGCGGSLTKEEEIPAEEPVVEEGPVEEIFAEEPAVEETPCCEVPEAKKNNKWIAIIVAIVAALAVVAVGVSMIFGGGKETAVSTGDAHHINAFGNPSYSIHYTKADDGTVTYDYMNEAGELISVPAEEVEALLDAEIATCGDYVLTNRDLPYYFSESYYNITQMYGYFISLIINGAQGLDEQLSTDGESTWQYVFVDSAVDAFRQRAGVAMEAKAQGFDMTEVEQEVETYKAQLQSAAEQSGYENMEDFLCDILGPGNTVEACLAYYELSVLYMEYTDMLVEKISVTEEEVDAYYAENEATLTEQGITKVDKNVVNVRHILIQPEQTTAEDGTTSISDEAWAAAEKQAQAIYDQWLAGAATEASFAELAAANTTDPGSQSTGGLYEGVYPGQMVAEFNDWCFADGREVGDHGMVKTSYGYHVMFFSGEGDYVYWRKQVKDTVINEKLMADLAVVQEGYPMKADLSKVIMMESLAPTIPSEENPGGPVIEEVDPSEVPMEHTHTHTEE